MSVCAGSRRVNEKGKIKEETGLERGMRDDGEEGRVREPEGVWDGAEAVGQGDVAGAGGAVDKGGRGVAR
jgi:hypothetical protein